MKRIEKYKTQGIYIFENLNFNLKLNLEVDYNDLV